MVSISYRQLSAECDHLAEVDVIVSCSGTVRLPKPRPPYYEDSAEESRVPAGRGVRESSVDGLRLGGDDARTYASLQVLTLASCSICPSDKHQVALLRSTRPQSLTTPYSSPKETSQRPYRSGALAGPLAGKRTLPLAGAVSSVERPPGAVSLRRTGQRSPGPQVPGARPSPPEAPPGAARYSKF